MGLGYAGFPSRCTQPRLAIASSAATSMTSASSASAAGESYFADVEYL